MENKQSFILKINFIAIVLVILSMIFMIIMPTSYKSVFAETGTSWNYPSDWTKIGGDQDFVAVRASTVHISDYYNGNIYYREGSYEDASYTIEYIQQSGDPTMYVRRTFLKGYFENSWYIAVLVDLEMDPSDYASGDGTTIRSANATISSYIYKANKVGSWIVTYWPTTQLGGRYAAGAPVAVMDSSTQSISIDAGFQGKEISGSFSIGYSKDTPRLRIEATNLKTDNEANGFESKYLYYKPYENNVAYTESKSVLKYVAIYRCDSEIEYYDIKVETQGEFFCDRLGYNLIVRANRQQDFYMKPSTGFYKTYA